MSVIFQQTDMWKPHRHAESPVKCLSLQPNHWNSLSCRGHDKRSVRRRWINRSDLENQKVRLQHFMPRRRRFWRSSSKAGSCGFFVELSVFSGMKRHLSWFAWNLWKFLNVQKMSWILKNAVKWKIMLWILYYALALIFDILSFDDTEY